MGENMNQPDSMELTLTITPKQAAAIVETMKAAIEKIVQLARELAEWAGNVIRQLAAAMPNLNDLMERLLYEANDNPKWWHLYKHAKKHRTRKKYRRRLMQQLFSKWSAAQEAEA